MGSKLFRTLVGVGISLGVTSSGCWGQSNAHGESRGKDEGDSDSSGSVGGASHGTTDGSALTQEATTTNTTTSTTSTVGVTTGETDPETVTSTTGLDTSTSDGSGGAPSVTGGAGGEPGTAGAGGDSGLDPFCDATWPTTKGNPGIPECVDPNHECQELYPERCMLSTGEFACDGDFTKSWAPFCVDGNWQCEPGLVPATECKCFTPLAEEYICTSEGPVPRGEVHP